jgi:hypothetical protein
MTRSERAIFKQARVAANRRHVDAIGWRLENMRVGARLCEEATRRRPAGGHTDRPFHPPQAPSGLEKTVDDLLERARPRSEHDVRQLEDLFYCAHNAARSAQRGGKTVPRG